MKRYRLRFVAVALGATLAACARQPTRTDETGSAALQTGRVRQRPCNGHSLGVPAHTLFNGVERDFSHGCVRPGDPQALARYVPRDRPEWTPEKISGAEKKS